MASGGMDASVTCFYKENIGMGFCHLVLFRNEWLLMWRFRSCWIRLEYFQFA